MLPLVTLAGNSKVIIIGQIDNYGSITEDNPLISICDSAGNETLENANDFFSITTASAQKGRTIITPKKALPPDLYLALLADNKGGYIRMSYKCELDSILIKKWTIINNSLPDSVYGVKTYSATIDDSTSLDIDHVEYYAKAKKYGGMRIHKVMQVEVNGNALSIPLKTNTKEITSIRHGYTPAKTYQAYVKNKDPQKHFHYFRVYNKERRIISFYSGAIRFECPD